MKESVKDQKSTSFIMKEVYICEKLKCDFNCLFTITLRVTGEVCSIHSAKLKHFLFPS